MAEIANVVSVVLLCPDPTPKFHGIRFFPRGVLVLPITVGSHFFQKIFNAKMHGRGIVGLSFFSEMMQPIPFQDDTELGRPALLSAFTPAIQMDRLVSAHARSLAIQKALSAFVVSPAPLTQKLQQMDCTNSQDLGTDVEHRVNLTFQAFMEGVPELVEFLKDPGVCLQARAGKWQRKAGPPHPCFLVPE